VPPALVDRALAAALPALPALHLAESRWRLLDLIARAPLLRAEWLALALAWDRGTVRRALADLAALGLIRRLDPADPAEYYKDERTRAAAATFCARYRPVEATLDGLAALADRAGLPLAAAAAWDGWSGGGPARDPAGRPRALGDRPGLAANLAHTDGAYGVWMAAVRTANAQNAARECPDEEWDDADWWSAAACARGSMRPDGGLHYSRRGRWHEGNLEYDCGTEDRDDYRRKLGAYREFAASPGGRAWHGDDPMPILFVTTRPAAEELFLEAARLELAGATGLVVLTTTTTRLGAEPEGLLAAIWRTPSTGAHRHYWIAPDPVPPTTDRPDPTRAAWAGELAEDDGFEVEPEFDRAGNEL